MCEVVIFPWWSFSSIQFKMKPFICLFCFFVEKDENVGYPLLVILPFSESIMSIQIKDYMIYLIKHYCTK